MDFYHSMLAFSNLAGVGPDTIRSDGSPFPQALRFTNVGSTVGPDGSTSFLDLEVTSLSGYATGNASRNGRTGGFAQINFQPNTVSNLRMRIRPSCATSDSCALCDDPEIHPSNYDREQCYARGCSCFKTLCYKPSCCMGSGREDNRRAYSCAWMDVDLTLPGGSLLGFSIYDLDTGAPHALSLASCRQSPRRKSIELNSAAHRPHVAAAWAQRPTYICALPLSGLSGEYSESVTIGDYYTYRTPMRPTSGGEIASTVVVDAGGNTFTASGRGGPSGNPNDPLELNDEQAASAVQFFFEPKDGCEHGRLDSNRVTVPGFPCTLMPSFPFRPPHTRHLPAGTLTPRSTSHTMVGALSLPVVATLCSPGAALSARRHRRHRPRRHRRRRRPRRHRRHRLPRRLFRRHRRSSVTQTTTSAATRSWTAGSA